MSEQDLKKALEKSVPEVPQRFHLAMERTLAHIEDTPKPVWHARRALALVIALLLGTAAYAAYRWQVFQELSFMTGESPLHADSVMQSDLHTETVNGVQITIHEAGYDGRTLFIRYSHLTPDGRTPYEHGVGWWIDHFWIDGECMDMAANSGSSTSIGERGEVIQTEYWRLDNLGVALSGKVRISLPIGQRQSVADYNRKNHPEKYDENGMMILPQSGMVSFVLDTQNALAAVVSAQPNIPTVLPEVTAQVSEVSFTPLMTYITLDLAVNPEALERFIAENGEGYYNESGELLFPYTGADVFDPWIMSLELVDGEGNQLFPGHWGINGHGAQWAEFLYPHIEDMSQELWLAPVEGGKGDLTLGVRVR